MEAFDEHVGVRRRTESRKSGPQFLYKQVNLATILLKLAVLTPFQYIQPSFGKEIISASELNI